MALCGGIVLEEALDLSSDRLLSELIESEDQWVPSLLILYSDLIVIEEVR